MRVITGCSILRISCLTGTIFSLPIMIFTWQVASVKVDPFVAWGDDLPPMFYCVIRSSTSDVKNVPPPPISQNSNIHEDWEQRKAQE